MPGGDGTGPAGMGPMTGRAAGYCAGYPVPGFMNPYGGRGLGMAWGRGGWGRGWGFYPGAYAGVPRSRPPYGMVPFWRGPSREEELDTLREQADWLKEQLEAVNERIGELETEQD